MEQHQSELQPDIVELPQVVRSVNKLPEQLGFVETEEMHPLRGQVVEVMGSGSEEGVKELVSRYHLLGQGVVNQLQGPNFPRGQLGLMIAMGNIRRDAGKWDAYVEDLQDALDYCYGMGYEDVAPTLVLTLLHARQQLEESQKPESKEYDGPTSQEIADALHGAVDQDDFEDVAGMEGEEALGYAFTLLLEAGIEGPEEFLKEKGILE